MYTDVLTWYWYYNNQTLVGFVQYMLKNVNTWQEEKFAPSPFILYEQFMYRKALQFTELLMEAFKFSQRKDLTGMRDGLEQIPQISVLTPVLR